ncbi:glucosamine-6-phosphate deaminase [Akkermansiaceae bacterium]|nr:glucosamine-6-phosphate deaminase [Akkermansiaceae bacterium]
MEIIIQETKQQASDVAARLIAKLITEKPDCVLGLATGSTPLPLYRRLIEMKLDWGKVTTFNLDEYIGLPREHPQTYHTFMWENLFHHVNINADNVHIPDGNAADIPAFCQEYEERIKAAGGIDLQVLGIGTDGHIGFNEPTSSLASRTRIKTLTEQTCKDNARFFGSEEKVPNHVITMGIGTIMEARTNLLLAFGENKAQAIAEAVEGPVTSINPASALQMHPVVKVLIDAPAASKLERIDYFRWVHDNKPDWQKI